MKQKLLLSSMTLFFVLSVGFIPRMILASVTQVELCPVTMKHCQNTVSGNGEIIEKRVKEVYLETPVIASSVPVEVGDWVQPGQLLAQIDTQLTQSVLNQGVVAVSHSEDSQSAVLEALAAQYGLTQQQVQAAAEQYGLVRSGAPNSSQSEGFIPKEIIAPMEGVITQINLQTDVLSAGGPAFVVSDTAAYAVKVSVSESDISRVKEGAAAEISGVGLDGKRYHGVVSKVYPAARKTLQGTVQQTVVDVEIELVDSDRKLKPGFSVKALIYEGEGELLPTVPYEAVEQDASNQEYVYVYHNNRVQKRYIQTGSELSDAVVVESGLKPDDRVVWNPQAVAQEDAFVTASWHQKEEDNA